MKLFEALEESHSGKLVRIKKLFIKGYKQFIAGKSRDTRLDFIQEVIDETLSRSDRRFLILRLQKAYQNKKK